MSHFTGQKMKHLTDVDYYSNVALKKRTLFEEAFIRSKG